MSGDSGKRRARQRPSQPGRRRSGGPTQARLIATRVLERVQRTQAFADLALHHAFTHSDLAAQERALATELVYGTLRWRGRLDYLLSSVVDRELGDLEPMVANTLRLAAYQIVFTDRIPSMAAVDQAVHCTRALGAERATGLVNASLRRLAREHEQIVLPALETDPLGHLTHALSLPEWIAKRFLDDYGPEEAAALARASNLQPPLTVRCNRLVRDPDTLLTEVLERFPEAARCKFASDGIVLGRRGAAGHDPAFLAGHYTPQDEAAQLVVELLDPQSGEHVLDCCAAPGGKSTAIAERVGPEGFVVALDRHAARLRLVTRAARRLGIECIRAISFDATKSLDGLSTASASPDDPNVGGGAEEFDRVLVDAPCSGLGTLRRNPDARWRVRMEDVAPLSDLQGTILRRASSKVKPGGTLVYSTCTILTEENEQIVQSFLETHTNFRLVAKSESPTHLAPLIDDHGFLRCWPHRHDADGFFAARLERMK